MDINQKPYFECQKHQKKVDFFCSVNQWHFVPLCNECIPEHTQNHQKRKAVSIQGVDTVFQKFREQKEKGIQLYTNTLKQIQVLLEHKKPEYQQTLDKIRKKFHEQVDKYIDKIEEQIFSKRKETEAYEEDFLKKIYENLQLDISDLEKTEQIQKINQWAQIAKRSYFKNGVQKYVDEYNDCIKDSKQRLEDSNYLHYRQNNFNKAIEDIKTAIKSVISVLPEKPKKQLIPKDQIDPKKKVTKVVAKQKKCKNCNVELEYLTQRKQHLICRQCGQSVRNYTQRH